MRNAKKLHCRIGSEANFPDSRRPDNRPTGNSTPTPILSSFEMMEKDVNCRGNRGLVRSFLGCGFFAREPRTSQPDKAVHPHVQPPTLDEKAEMPQCPAPASCHGSGYIGGLTDFLNSPGFVS